MRGVGHAKRDETKRVQMIPKKLAIENSYLLALVIIDSNYPSSSIDGASGLFKLNFYLHLEKCDIVFDKSLCNV